MERKKLIDVLKKFLSDFDAEKINNYFATDFGDDWDEYLVDDELESVLQYLNDCFIDIDIDYRDTNQFERKVRETLQTAIKMIEDTK